MMPKLPQIGWSHGMFGAHSEVASRPYESLRPPRDQHHLTSPQNICFFHYHAIQHHRMVQVGGHPGGHMVQFLAQRKTNFKARLGCWIAQLCFEYLQGRK